MSNEPIFARIERAIAECAKRDIPATKLFLGIEEWDFLSALCAKWGVDDWPPGTLANYSPHDGKTKRARFGKCEIYRVDAQTFLQVS